MMKAMITLTPRNNLEQMNVSGLRETVLGRPNEACCGDCRFLYELYSSASGHPCLRGHGRKSPYARFAVVCPDFLLSPHIDDERNRRTGIERRYHATPVAVERRRGSDRRSPTVDRPVAARAPDEANG